MLCCYLHDEALDGGGTNLCFFLQKICSLCFGRNQEVHKFVPLSYTGIAREASIEVNICRLLTMWRLAQVSTDVENYSCLVAMDGETELQMLSFESPKIRLLRSLSVEGNDGMQVLDLAVFPRPEFDLPIFCANFFTTTSMNIVVLDLNPLHDVINQEDYKEKYYKHLIPLGLQYAELLPWGGKITTESLKFFSPIVIWTKFSPSQDKHHALYSAFKDYLKSWLELMNHASGENDVLKRMMNLESQHRYLTWRAEKDPGHQILRKLVGETFSKEIIKNFLFNGVDELGSKTFTDYFPEYMCDDGTINQKRSMIGKSFETRPWDARGEFIGNSLR